MDAFGESVVVFDADGGLVFASRNARAAINARAQGSPEDAEHLMPVLARLGGRISPIRVGTLTVGEAVYLPGDESPRSLADQEKQAIVKTLDRTQWRLAETARMLGISRTTLWRRLKTYGLDRDRRGQWMGPGARR
jgi:transcriptional regulator of acetoin/glycerol metabolism